ncbi:JmjC domain, hydroxylase-domain-containing protein [Radiomyces spectabilis]|uniref:JmjC domain, hydroxylase-domain-containing protein n=1 Tax=Radiomyces spectabilis TaxID=64574 RepID=UPI0022212610|nr:JmjC domain, hydroxylase-domain-containing protein [Radiomyces spectabilis]KAI8372752.1 JmjC domain, hydroxylase-domain-containing protein [Radiomyces spectabilis]
MDQFKDFRAFVEAIDDYGKEAGIVKVIPPKEWKQSLPDVQPLLSHIRVRNPIIQHIIGTQGIYTQTNVEKRRPFTLEQWCTLCNGDEHGAPDLGIDRTLKKPVSGHRKQKSSTQWRQEIQEIRKRKRQQAADELALARSDTPTPFPGTPRCTNPNRYTPDYCKDLERAYWRNLTFNQPMYGADMTGSLFDSSVRSWNVAHLDNILNNLDVALPGVNTPYLYFGMWKATFAWHVEDMDLYSINYLHFGAPKQWYVIPPAQRKKFEGVMQNIFFQQHKACHQFLRHKTFIVSPKILANHGVQVQRCVQHEGEFMLTFPFGYHSGYNLGFNCAESVNFALDSWLEIGKQAESCQCVSDSVMIDVSSLEQSLTLSFGV